MGLPYGWAALVQSLKGVGYESASVRYDHVLDFYVGDVLMRKLLLIMALMAPGWAVAAVVVTPQIAGYSGGGYRAAAGSFAMTAANDGFISQAVTNVGGKAITIPATMRMAANAGEVALAGMRLTPWGLVGTLAAGWLAQQGLEWAVDHWAVNDTAAGAGYQTCTGSSGTGTGDPAAIRAAIEARWMTRTDSPAWVDNAMSGRFDYQPTTGAYVGYTIDYMVCVNPVPATRPATDSDWSGLPSPLPAVAPELPYAPYMPGGVPVSKPEYAPSDVPLGNPYTKPDGSTVQPRAKISPSGDGQVTVATYDQPLTDAQGQPVSNPVPLPTPDQPPDLCQLHPESVACMTSGGPPSFVPPTDGGVPADPSIVAAGGAIDWHQHFLDESSACGLADVSYSVMNQQFTIPLSSLCQYLPILKAVVIFLASVVSIRMFALAPW